MLWVHIVNHLQVFRIRRLTRWFLPSKLFCYSKQISLLLFCILLLCTVPRLVYYCPCVYMCVISLSCIVLARVLGHWKLNLFLVIMICLLMRFKGQWVQSVLSQWPFIVWKLNLFLVIMICLLMRFKGQWVQSVLSQWPFIVWSALQFIFACFVTSACACSIHSTCVPSIKFGYGVVCLGSHLFMSLCEVEMYNYFVFINIMF